MSSQLLEMAMPFSLPKCLINIHTSSYLVSVEQASIDAAGQKAYIKMNLGTQQSISKHTVERHASFQLETKALILIQINTHPDNYFGWCDTLNEHLCHNCLLNDPTVCH